MHICKYEHIQVYIRILMYVYVHTCTSVCIDQYMCLCILKEEWLVDPYMYIHAVIHIYLHTRKLHVYTCSHSHLSSHIHICLHTTCVYTPMMHIQLCILIMIWRNRQLWVRDTLQRRCSVSRTHRMIWRISVIRTHTHTHTYTYTHTHNDCMCTHTSIFTQDTHTHTLTHTLTRHEHTVRHEHTEMCTHTSIFTQDTTCAKMDVNDCMCIHLTMCHELTEWYDACHELTEWYDAYQSFTSIFTHLTMCHELTHVDIDMSCDMWHMSCVIYTGIDNTWLCVTYLYR